MGGGDIPNLWALIGAGQPSDKTRIPGPFVIVDYCPHESRGAVGWLGGGTQPSLKIRMRAETPLAV